MAVEITLGEAHEIKQFVTLTLPLEGSMTCPEGHTQSPKAQSSVMAGKEDSKDPWSSACNGGLATRAHMLKVDS